MTQPAAPQIPDGPDDLTAEWLTAAIQSTGRTEESVDEVEVSRIGTGQTGTAWRISLMGEVPDGYQPAYVAKLPALDPDVRTAVAAGCSVEVAFYQNVAATLEVPVPQCHFSAVEGDGVSFVLLMSDLAPAAQGDQIKGCSLDEALPAARALSGLHAPRWCDASWFDSTLVMMPKPEPNGAFFLGELAKDATRQFVETLGPRMSAADRATFKAGAERFEKWLLLHPERFSLLHGDYRLDNLMFDPSGEVTVVDWQTLAVGLPARDLAYFVATSLMADDRTRHEWELVEAYHDSLVERGVDSYDLETCRSDYRLGVLQVVLITSLGWTYSATTDRGDDMMLVMAERGCRAIRELETLELVDQLSES